MKCPEKEDLQQKCSAAWNEYEQTVNEFKERVSSQLGRDPQSVPVPNMLMMLPEPVLAYVGHASIEAKKGSLLDVALLRKKHLAASNALSRHLSSHHC
jgi:hypothetical protein